MFEYKITLEYRQRRNKTICNVNDNTYIGGISWLFDIAYLPLCTISNSIIMN